MAVDKATVARLTKKGWALLLWEYQKAPPGEDSRDYKDWQALRELIADEVTEKDKRRAGPYNKTKKKKAS